VHRLDFSRLIKRRRAELKISQIDMASMLEISYRHFQDIEAGKINLRLDTIVKISEKLNLHLCIENNRIREGLPEGNLPSLQEFGNLASELEIGIAIINHDNTYFYANSFLAQINGISADDHIGKSISQVVPEMAVKLEKAMAQTLKNQEIQIHEVSGLIPRDLFQTSYKIALLPYSADKVIAFINDISLLQNAHDNFKELSTKLNLRISIPSMNSPLKKIDRDAALGNYNYLKSLLLQFYR